MGSSVASLASADLQSQIGDLFADGQNGGEGSIGHVLAHAAVGCGAAVLSGASCGAGALGGAAQSLYAGTDPATRLTPEQVERNARLIGAVAGYLGSEGKGENVSIAASVAASGARNNYLNHSEELLRHHAKWELADCLSNDNCSEEQLASLQKQVEFWNNKDADQDAALMAACNADAASRACIGHVKAAFAAQGWYDPNAGNPFGGNAGPNLYRNLEWEIERAGQEAVFDETVKGRAKKALWDEYQQTRQLLASLPQSTLDAAWRDVGLDFAVAAIVAGTGFAGTRGVTAGGRQPKLGNVNSTQVGRTATGTVKHANGVSLPKSQSQMIKEFKQAGYPTKTVISPTSGKNVGIQYTLPDGTRVRVMQADSRSPKRASFENANGQPIDPTTGKPPQPPSGMTRAERKKYVRGRTHIVQDD